MKKKVLFLCTGNSCRSQMAEGLLKHFGNNKYEVFSAGTNPVSINVYSIKVMEEIGIDISCQTSNHIEEYKNIDFDLVISVCDNARETCPIYFSKTPKIHWGFEDPASVKGNETEILTSFRNIRDQIKQEILTYFHLSLDK
ncbi:MAG: arsenate reductase ArsC [Cyanobacteriota bacterium]